MEAEVWTLARRLPPGQELRVLHLLEDTLGDVLPLLEVDQAPVGSRAERSQVLLYLSQLSFEFIDPIRRSRIHAPALDTLHDRRRRANDEHEDS